MWSDDEQASFERVLDVFEQRTGARSHLRLRRRRDCPPCSPPGWQAARRRTSRASPSPRWSTRWPGPASLVPLDAATEAVIDEQFAPVWKELGTVDGELYGFVFKAANKSTIWYDADQLGPAFVPPRTWDEFIDLLRKRSDTGDTPLSVGGADGWTLTDWFENVYLQTAGGADVRPARAPRDPVDRPVRARRRWRRWAGRSSRSSCPVARRRAADRVHRVGGQRLRRRPAGRDRLRGATSWPA